MSVSSVTVGAPGPERQVLVQVIGQSVVSLAPPVSQVVSLVATVAPGSLGGAFLVTNRFSELATPLEKLVARQNLELQAIDCGEFL